jgi:succinate dehydrogenase / fumarate reductase cytochrome b subunit
MKLFSFLFTSTIGRKWLMGLTGLFLISFLLVHCGVNACIFFNDGGETFNMAAEFMGTNWIIRSMEFVLFAGLLLHIFQGLYLWKFNTEARKKRYSVSAGSANSTWYSRSMGILGTLLLLFLVMHLKDFWVTSRFTDVITSGEKTLFQEMKEVFANPLPVVVYVLGCVSLLYHLLHGFQSAFQTLGINHKSYTPIIQSTGKIFSVVVSLLFAAMPVAMHLGWIQ